MSNETSKISELNRTSIIPENSLIPISTNKLETSSVDLNTLRSSLWFESAYSDFSIATDNTEKGESFFVYADANKESVLGWVNQGGGTYSKLTGLDGQQITFLTVDGVRKVQKSIGFVTLEVFGGGVNVDNNSPALQAYFDAAYAGLCGELRLGAGSYKLKSAVTAKCPVTIVGQGKVNTSVAGVSNQHSEFIDARGNNATGFLINLTSDKVNSFSTIGFYLYNFAIVGKRANNNQGLYISAISWQGQINTIRIDKFGKEGFACDHLNDTMWFDVAILDCGGYVDGVAYYAFDTDTYTTTAIGRMNQNQFYRLHIEYGRYLAKISAWFCTFNDCHFEVGTGSSYSYDEYQLPWIDIKQVNNPITFSGCNFIPPNFTTITQGVVDTTDLAGIVKRHSPAIGSTSTSTSEIGPTDYIINTEVRFTDCSFVLSNGIILKVIDLPLHNLSMTNCRFKATQSSQCYAINGGSQLSLINNKFFTQTRTDNTSIYAAYINKATNPLIMVNGQYCRAADNVFWHATAVSLGLTVNVVSFANKSSNNLVNYLENNVLFGFAAVAEQSFNKIYWGASHDFRKKENDDTEGFVLTGSTIRHYSPTSNFNITLGTHTRITAITSSIKLIEDAGDNVYRMRPATNLLGYLGTISNQWGRSYIGGWQLETGLTPLTTATQSIGSSGSVVKDIFLTNAPTIISDENYKPVIEDLDRDLLEAVGSVPYKMYKLYNAIKEKGTEKARWHSGVLAQDIKKALDDKGLNWNDYGLLTYEELTAEVTIDEEGHYKPLDGGVKIAVNDSGYIDFIEGAMTLSESDGKTYLTKGIYMVRMEEFLVLKMAYLESLMGS